jgi:hypothetical protein
MKQLIQLSTIILFAVITFFLSKSSFNTDINFLIKKTVFNEKEDLNKRSEQEFRMLRNPVTGKIPKSIRQKELAFVKKIPEANKNGLFKLSKVQGLNFKSRGPVNRGGRVRALAVDMRSTANNVTIIAAGVSGGIWRSTDNGNSWKQTSLPSQIHSATCIVQDPRAGHQDTWYVGTGESHGNSATGGNASYFGDGIFKSTDNGLTWQLLPATVSGTPQSFDNIFDFVNQVAVNPVTGSIFAAAINMIERSTDGGTTWKGVLSTPKNSSYSDVTITASGIIYATISSSVANPGIWKSTDDGASWTNITPADFPADYRRCVIASAPSNENRIYLLAYIPNSGKKNVGFWVSDNAGASWRNATNNLPDANGNVAGIDPQGGYNLVINVKPDDPDFVVFGGTNLYRSTDGMMTKLENKYKNWIGGYSVADDISQYENHHPDQHALCFAPFNSKILYSGNDGGIQITNDITATMVSWTDINNGFITSQFYSISMDQATANDPVLLGGLQDNGHYFVNSNNPTANWVEMIGGGDGGFTAVANHKAYYYIETQNGDVIRLQLNGSGNYVTWTVVKPNYTTYYLFTNPYVLDPNYSNVMYFVAGDSLWRNTNLSEIPNFSNNPTLKNWSCLSNTRTGDMITAVAVSKTPGNIVYYGTSDGQVFQLKNAIVGNPVPKNISDGKGLPAGYVSAIAVDPNNAYKALVVFSNYEVVSLYYTSNAGATWTAVAGNLEENTDGTGNGPSCRWASIMKYNNVTTYYVATSAGLYSTSQLNGNNTKWLHESPNEIGVAVCTMVKTRQLDGEVVVATHGAGVFSANASETDVKPVAGTPSDFFLSQNYPNPFNPTTNIDYSIPESGLVTLRIYNIQGQLISEPLNRYQNKGNYTLSFNASQLASGTYIYELQNCGRRISKKMILLK